MEYSNLIQGVLANPTLAKAVTDMVAQTGMLNLVNPEWESTLNDYPIHKLHVEKQVSFTKGHACNHEGAYVRNVSLPSQCYKAIVMGCFSGNRIKPKELDGSISDMSFVVRECPPLTTIAEAMAENKGQKLHDGARLFMENCYIELCSQCKSLHEEHKVPYELKTNWCVSKLRLFDGQTIKNTFKNVLVPIVENMGQFLAICQVVISSRTVFGENKYKIGGRIKHMIVFQESSIQPAIEMNVMDCSSLQAIEYPSTKDDDEEVIIQYP